MPLDEQSLAIRKHMARTVARFRADVGKMQHLSWQRRHDSAWEMYRQLRVLDDMYKFGPDGYVAMSDALYRVVPHLKESKKDLLHMIRLLRPKTSQVVHIGVNDYIFTHGKYYQYRYLSDSFYHIAEDDLFGLIPERKEKANPVIDYILRHLWNTRVKQQSVVSLFDRFMRTWGKVKPIGIAELEALAIFPRRTNTARQYVSKLEHNIMKKLLPAPIYSPSDLKELLNQGTGKFITSYRKNLVDNLEDTVKVLSKSVDFVLHLRKKRKGFRRIYLLRDALSMYFVDRLMDKVFSTNALSADYFFLKRDMLTKPQERQYYFLKFMRVVCSIADEMKKWTWAEFMRRMQARMPNEIKRDNELGILMKRVSELCLREKVFANPKVPLTLIDTGFRGSIPLTIIASAIYLRYAKKKRLPRIEVDLYLSALFWGELFKKRFFSPDTSYMWAAERLFQSEYLFNYKPDTFFKPNGPFIIVGPKDVERLCLMEFIILVSLVRFLKSTRIRYA